VRRPVLTVLVLTLALTGCGGKGGSSGNPGGGGAAIPVIQSGGNTDTAKGPASLGFPGFATKNTTRVGGGDPVADAAGVALAVFPSQSAATRPGAVTLADGNDWRAATAAAALMAPPVRAPLLLSDGTKLPDATQAALKVLRPTGSQPAGGGQVLAVGAAPDVDGQKVTRISDKAPGPFALAGAIDRFLAAAKGKPSAAVVVVSASRPDMGIPAAAWAAKSGDPVLFVTKTGVPAATVRALKTHVHPRIYVLGPTTVIGPSAIEALRRLGTVTRIAGANAVTNAIAFARFNDGRFGWGVTDPGHGLLFANVNRPADGAAASALASAGAYGPLLLIDQAETLPPALAGFLLDVQPGYRVDPVRGVYNHGWLMGDEKAISLGVQAKIDQALEIAPVSTK
jgi:ell wall binding domain 2 (CWB2)